MPNWTDNTLTVSCDGSHESITQLHEWLEALASTQEIEPTNGAFYSITGAFCPMPESVGEDGWYEWQQRNWGVKWGDCHTRIVDVSPTDDIPREMTVRYETPWGTARPLLWKISMDHPLLNFVNEAYFEDDDYHEGELITLKAGSSDTKPIFKDDCDCIECNPTKYDEEN